MSYPKRSQNPNMIDTNPTSSEESVSALRTRRTKKPFISFYLLSDTKEVQQPEERYGADNRTHCTLRVSHNRILHDRPGHTYRPSAFNHLEAVNVDRLDLHELYLISRYLRYSTMGIWYYFNEGPNASLELLPLHIEDHMASFRDVIREHQCRAIKKVYVEHGTSAELYKLIPTEVMVSGKNRLKKLLYLKLLENPEATVEEGMERVRSVTRLEVSREQVEATMQEASEHLGMW